MQPGLADELRRDAGAKEGLRQEFEQLLEDRRVLTDPRLGPFARGKAEPPVPVNLTRLIVNAKKTFKVDPNKPSELKPLDIVHKVKDLLTRLDVVVGEDSTLRALYCVSATWVALPTLGCSSA